MPSVGCRLIKYRVFNEKVRNKFLGQETHFHQSGQIFIVRGLEWERNKIRVG